MNIVIKDLDSKLVERANNNSLNGKRGEQEEHDYQLYCKKAISWNLSERKTQKIINKIYTSFSEMLLLASQHVSAAVAGGSNYNAKKLDKSDRILSTSRDFVDWFKELESQATAKPYSRITYLIKNIIMCVTNDLSASKQWEELAGRSRKDFNILYSELNAKYNFKKTSIQYKIYHNIVDIPEIIQTTIYSDNDFEVFKENDKLCIKFRMKPQRQLIVALKSRKFVWISSQEMWRVQATEQIEAWAKSIAECYADYI